MLHQPVLLITKAKTFLFLISFAVLCQLSFAQPNLPTGQAGKTIDSLMNVLKTAAEDTNKVKTLNALIDQLWRIAKYAEAKKYADDGLSLSEQLHFNKGIALSYHNIGNIYFAQGNYPEALKNYLASLKIRKEIGDKEGINGSYNNIGNIYSRQGNYPEALKNYLASLKIREEIGDKQGIAWSYNNIGIIYEKQGNYPEALKNHFVSLKIREEIADKRGLASSYNNIGGIYYMQGNYPAGLKYFMTSLKTMEEIGDTQSSFYVNIHVNVGHLHYDLGNYAEALKEFRIVLKIGEATGNKNIISVSYHGIGNIYFAQGNYPESLKNYLASLKIQEEIGDKLGIAMSYNEIGKLYQRQGNYPKALENYLASLKVFEEIGNKKDIAVPYNSIGEVYQLQGNYSEALKNHHAALKISKETGDKENIAFSYINLGKVNIQLNKPGDAKEFLNNALSIGKETGIKDLVKQIYVHLSTLDSTIGNYQQALVHHKQYMVYKDSLLNEANSKQIVLMKAQYESEKKDKEILQLTSDKQKMESEMQVTVLFIKSKEDSLKFVQSEKEKIRLEKEKTDALNLYNLQQLTLLAKDKRLQELQIEKNEADLLVQKAETEKKQSDYLVQKAEADRKQEQLLVLNKEKTIQSLDLKKQKQAKNFFIAGLALFAILSFFVYRNYRTRQKLKLQTLRNKIARDLHDDVGSTLSSISIFSEMAQQQSKEVIPLLETIGESSRKMLDAMADIVWTINPENDQFEKIILRMRSFAYELLGAKKIDFEFVADEDVAKMKLPMEVRKNLYLIFKEATNNMVKYSEADRAFFSVKREGNDLTMLIRDNGNGFDINHPKQGNGIGNMRKRAGEMGAVISIDSLPGNGTTIKLKVAV